jgi:hypothetical protein
LSHISRLSAVAATKLKFAGYSQFEPDPRTQSLSRILGFLRASEADVRDLHERDLLALVRQHDQESGTVDHRKLNILQPAQ